jgi:predicted O-methyltransferase YrrM
VKHFWNTFDGYFNYPEFYSWVASEMSVRSPHLVEVGVYTGQSAAYLGVELVNRGLTQARLDLVDKFTDGGSVEVVLGRLAPLVETVLKTAHVGLSWECARFYENASLDFVMIDASHLYADVSRDIDAWRLKVKKGGILAGHDFCAGPNFGVMQAVCERFPRFEVWSGTTTGGDANMQGKHWPVWSVCP